jgi:hypothetical protein
MRFVVSCLVVYQISAAAPEANADAGSISYITAEMLGSFLARRDYEAHAVSKVIPSSSCRFPALNAPIGAG